MENKSFDLIWEGVKSEGIRICENGKGYRTSIFLNMEEDECSWHWRNFTGEILNFRGRKSLPDATMNFGSHLEAIKEALIWFCLWSGEEMLKEYSFQMEWREGGGGRLWNSRSIWQNNSWWILNQVLSQKVVKIHSRVWEILPHE